MLSTNQEGAFTTPGVDFQPAELGEFYDGCLRPPVCRILVIGAKTGDGVGGVLGRREVKTILGTFVFITGR